MKVSMIKYQSCLRDKSCCFMTTKNFSFGSFWINKKKKVLDKRKLM